MPRVGGPHHHANQRPPLAASPTPLLATAEDAPARAWLLRRQEQAAADLDGETAARYHLLRLRLAALEAKAAGLAALLGAD